MKVFLSGPPVTRPIIRSHSIDLRRLGITSTASWVDVPEAPCGDTSTSNKQCDLSHVKSRVALNLHDIEQSDIYVGFTTEHFNGWGFNPWQLADGARDVELGYAIARGLPVLIVGPNENSYQRAFGVSVRNWDMALISLMTRERDMALAAVANLRAAQKADAR